MPEEHPTLYKYLRKESGLKVLKNRTLRWSRPTTMNDIRELRMAFHTNLDYRRVREISVRKLWQVYANHVAADPYHPLARILAMLRNVELTWFEFFAEIAPGIDAALESYRRNYPKTRDELYAGLERSKLLCMSEAADINLMWAHYSEDHSGLVLGFRHIPERDTLWRLARPVDYVPAAPPFLNEEELSDFLSGHVSLMNRNRMLLLRFVFSKTADWSYEREQRIFAGDGFNPHDEVEFMGFHPSELQTIILGFRSPNDFVEQVRVIAAEHFPHAVIKRARPSNQGNFLEIV
jgi:hypothetical protein